VNEISPDEGLRRPPPAPTFTERMASLGDAIGVNLSLGRVVMVGLVLVVGLAVTAVVVLRPQPSPPEVALPFAEPDAAESVDTSTTGASIVFVHAAGAVASPGVYQVPSDARIADVVAAAGGAVADADLNRVNLAAVVEDGQQVYVPRIGEPAVAASSPGGSSGSGGDGGPVNLNTADAAALEALPGVGPTTATAIINHRTEHGAFQSVDDLLDVPGIGDAKLAQLRDLVTV
jgi:competence protein ComEA